MVTGICVLVGNKCGRGHEDSGGNGIPAGILGKVPRTPFHSHDNVRCNSLSYKRNALAHRFLFVKKGDRTDRHHIDNSYGRRNSCPVSSSLVPIFEAGQKYLFPRLGISHPDILASSLSFPVLQGRHGVHIYEPKDNLYKGFLRKRYKRASL